MSSTWVKSRLVGSLFMMRIYTIGLAVATAGLLSAALAGAATFYVDQVDGDDQQDGSVPARAWQTVARVNAADLQPNDTVLLKRDRQWRETLVPPASGMEDKPITFAAYGEGAHPLLLGSDDWSGGLWDLVRDNVWATPDHSFPEDIGHIAPAGIISGNRRFAVEELRQPWDFFYDEDRQRLLVYQEDAPGSNGQRLEIAVRPMAILAHRRNHLVFRDLAMAHASVHGFSGYNNAHIEMEGLQVSRIGGKRWGKQRVGYGNGVEFGGNVSQVRVARSYFADIYDSGISHQNWDRDGRTQRDVVFENNVIERCAVGIEVFSHSGTTRDCIYRNNRIRDIGRGWSGNGGLWAAGFRIVSTVIDFENLLVQGNHIENSLHCGMFLSGGEVNLDRNIVAGCDIGLYITGQGGNRPFTGLVTDNLIFHNTKGGIYIVDSKGPAAFRQNTIALNGDHSEWNRHNVTLDGAANTIRAYNIFYATDAFAVSINNATHVFDHNVYYRPDGPVIGWDNTRQRFRAAEFDAYREVSGQDAHSLMAEPPFNDIAAQNFGLPDGHPLTRYGARRPPPQNAEQTNVKGK